MQGFWGGCSIAVQGWRLGGCSSAGFLGGWSGNGDWRWGGLAVQAFWGLQGTLAGRSSSRSSGMTARYKSQCLVCFAARWLRA